MDAMELVEAIKSIPEKKKSLREAFEAIQHSLSSSSALTFPWNWRDVEDHISYIETGIYHRFRSAIKRKPTAIDDDGDGSSSKKTKKKDYENGDGDGSSENTKKKNYATTNAELLKSACINMDAKVLRSFLHPDINGCYSNKNIRKHRRFLSAVREPFSLALRSSAPDPALLILNALHGLNPRHHSNIPRDRLLNIRKTCVFMLEVLHPISSELGIKPALRERALTLALDWKSKIPKADKNPDTAMQALAFLWLLVDYGLVPAFEPDGVIDLLCVCIWQTNVHADLVKNLGLAEKAHDLIPKLNGKARELDAVKIVHALNLADKFPPVPLLKAHITRCKRRADELRKKFNNSVQAQNDAHSMEMAALVMVRNAIERCKLESEYPLEDLLERIDRLNDQKKADKKQSAATAAASSSKAQQQQQSKKQPHPSPATSVPATSEPVIAANSYPQSIQPHPERAPYIGVAGPWGPTATGSVYKHGGQTLYGGLGAIGYNSVPAMSASVIAANPYPQTIQPHHHQQQQSKKRPHPSPATSVPATSEPVIAANSYPQSIQPHPIGAAGPWGQTAAGSVSKHGGQTLYGGLGAIGSNSVPAMSASVIAANPYPQTIQPHHHHHQQQQSKKRPHPSPATKVPATSEPVIAANSYPQSIQPHPIGATGPWGPTAAGSVYKHGGQALYGSNSAPVIAANSYPQSIQPHPQRGLAERAPYVGAAGPWGPTATGSVYNHGGPTLYSGLAGIGSVYNHGGPSLSRITTDQGATRNQPKSNYSSEFLAGTSSLCDRAMTYNGHHLDGLLPSYGSSLHP